MNKKLDLDNIAALAEQADVSMMTVSELTYQIAGFDLKPLSPAKLVLLEGIGSSLVTNAPVENPVIDTFASLFILVSNKDALDPVQKYISARSTYLLSLKMSDEYQEHRFDKYEKAIYEYNKTISDFALTLNTLDVSEIKANMVEFIDLSLTAYKLITSKKN